MSRLRRVLRRLLRREQQLVIDLTDAHPDFLLAVQRLAEPLPSQRNPSDTTWLEYR